MIFLGYEVTANHTVYYIFYIFNSNYSLAHTLYIVYVNPVTHTILNYSAYVPSTSIFAFVKGNQTVYFIGDKGIQAIEFKTKDETLITSINNIILEEKTNNETIKLVFANYSGIANEQIPNLSKLAGNINLLEINSYTLLGLIVSIMLFIILRRVK